MYVYICIWGRSRRDILPRVYICIYIDVPTKSIQLLAYSRFLLLYFTYIHILYTYILCIYLSIYIYICVVVYSILEFYGHHGWWHWYCRSGAFTDGSYLQYKAYQPGLPTQLWLWTRAFLPLPCIHDSTNTKQGYRYTYFGLNFNDRTE